jgi:hypothetical protein
MPSRSSPWPRSSNAHLCRDNAQTFQITHPFHPLYGKSYSLVTYRHTWGVDRVYYHDEVGTLRSIPAGWTDVLGQDPFVMIAAGRSAFRVVDLLDLCRLVQGIAEQSLSAAGGEEGPQICKVNYAISVKGNMP